MEIKIDQLLNKNSANQMIDLKAEAEKTNSAEFSAYKSLRGGAAACGYENTVS
jgi:hypothetical protein